MTEKDAGDAKGEKGQRAVSFVEFDTYDQDLLRAASAARMIYVSVAGGPEGKWIHAVSNGPLAASQASGVPVRVVRLADICGLD